MNLWLNDPAAFQDDWQELQALKKEIAVRQQIEQALAWAGLRCRWRTRLFGWIARAR